MKPGRGGSCCRGGAGRGCVHKSKHGHKSGTAGNKRWSEALKRELVAALLKPGASVSVVARAFGVNASQVFSWRRRYGEAVDPATALPSASGMLPVIMAQAPGDHAQRSIDSAVYGRDDRARGLRRIEL
ncbi:MAG: transposase [Hyphomicrobiaceae bacterium]